MTAVIAPWNFPLAIPAGLVSAALVTGNPVIFKPSERSPMMGHWLTDIMREAGVPEEIFCCLPGGPDIGRALVLHPEITTIAFTGSKDVGLGILKDAGTFTPGQQMVKRVLAEMGGKNAIIVDETADLDDAITGIRHRSPAMRVRNAPPARGRSCDECTGLAADLTSLTSPGARRARAERVGPTVGGSGTEELNLHQRATCSPMAGEGRRWVPRRTKHAVGCDARWPGPVYPSPR